VDELIGRAKLNTEQHFVADPMVGSGSTLIAAAKKGYSAFGSDVNPYCQLIVSTKLLRPSTEDIEGVRQFVATIRKDMDVEDNTDRLLADYFPDRNRQALLIIERQIQNVTATNVRRILLAGWFFILEMCSNRKKDGNGLATRPSPVNDVYACYENVIDDILSDYNKYPLPHTANCTVYTGSATDFSDYARDFSLVSGKELGAVIFSPPYANSFDYFESYKLELLFGGFFTWDEFKAAKRKLIRNYRISTKEKIYTPYDIVEALCNEVELAIPQKEAITGKRDGRTRLMPNMLRSYFNDMGDVLKQLYEAMPKGSRCYIVVDQSAYVGVIVPTDMVLAQIAEEIGLSVEYISVCRRAATSAQQLLMYPYLKDSLRESIVSLVKE